MAEKIYHPTSILGCDHSADGTETTIRLQSADGEVLGLKFNAEQLDFFTTFLGNIEYENSLANDQAGQRPDEIAAIRPEIVKNVEAGHGQISGMDYKILMVELPNGLHRFLAFDNPRFDRLLRLLENRSSWDKPTTSH